jgi:UTP-glucose-1-phosphate uridylyltransferase
MYASRGRWASGHAILCAERLVQGEAFAVLLADDLMIGTPPIMQQMTELFAEHQCSILAVQEVPEDQTNRYGIVKGQPLSSRSGEHQGPGRETAPERCPIESGGGGPLRPDPGGI